MRLPYIPDPPPAATPLDAQIVSAIVARRAPRPLQPLDLTLLHSPPVASGWNSFLGAIRTQTTLADDIREIAICRVAVLNEAGYEWMHHAPLMEKGGVGRQGVESVRSVGLGEMGVDAGLDERQVAVVRYADAMTVGCVVPDEVFAEVRRLFSEREVVEITATVAAYNCVSRFLVALDVGEKNGKGVGGEEGKEERKAALKH
ncbi:hypothetical protein MMC08_001651 [Hypocenomyce scalaris]|nr:hypothetical protein [Hypocenomyce scalaris]